MGTYKISKEEIFDALLDCLDELEGEINKEDFKDMAMELYDNYKNFSN